MSATTGDPAAGQNGRRETQRKIGSRVLRAGQTVKIVGVKGDFRIRHFEGEVVSVYGGRPGREMHRSFAVDRIGRRPRKALERRGDPQGR